MTDFDRAFADRVREVFDGYQEPVDPAALARMRAALGHAPVGHARPVAPDRAAVAGHRARRRRGLLAALLAVAVMGGLWVQTRVSPSAPDVVATADPAAPPDVTPSPDTPMPDAPLPAPDAAGIVVADPLVASPPPARRSASGTGRARSGPTSDDTRQRPVPTPDPSAPAPAVGSSDPGPPDRVPDRAEVETPVTVAMPEIAGGAAVPETGRPAPPVLSGPSESIPELPARPSVTRASPYQIVLGTSTPLAGAASVGGVGVAGGIAREWPVAGRVSVSGGALVAYTRYAIDRTQTFVSLDLIVLDMDPSRRLDVATATQAETVALEVPLDVAFGIAEARGVRLGVSVGVTSAVYLSQSFRDEGLRYSGAFVDDGVSPDGVFVVTSEPYRAREGGGVLSRVELARQLNLGVVVAGGRGPSASVYARLPLGGLTDRDLDLTTVGVRLRVPLR